VLHRRLGRTPACLPNKPHIIPESGLRRLFSESRISDFEVFAVPIPQDARCDGRMSRILLYVGSSSQDRRGRSGEGPKTRDEPITFWSRGTGTTARSRGDRKEFCSVFSVLWPNEKRRYEIPGAYREAMFIPDIVPAALRMVTLREA